MSDYLQNFYSTLKSIGINVIENENDSSIVRKLPDGSIVELHTVSGSTGQPRRLIEYLIRNEHKNFILYKTIPFGIRFFSW